VVISPFRGPASTLRALKQHETAVLSYVLNLAWLLLMVAQQFFTEAINGHDISNYRSVKLRQSIAT